MSRNRRTTPWLLAFLAVAGAALAGPTGLEAPTDSVLVEARKLVEGMQANPRGPYKRLRWFCKDGTILPPQPYGCRPHGGGIQHGEFSAERERLAALGYRVGTVVAATSWDELWDAKNRHDRLRELSLERYMREVQDGWVMRRARDYRGHVQVEDEERVGKAHLVQLLGNTEWLGKSSNFLLARETVRVIPHDSSGTDRTREVRRLALELSDRDERFLTLRIRVHSSPGPAVSEEVRRWIAENRSSLDAESLAIADKLDAGLSALFGDAELENRFQASLSKLTDPGAKDFLLGLKRRGQEGARVGRIEAWSQLLEWIREQVEAPGSANTKLLLMDLSIEVEGACRGQAFAMTQEGVFSRREGLQAAEALTRASHGVGLLTSGERDALVGTSSRALREDPVALSDYRAATRMLERAGAWSLASVRDAFAEALTRYQALEPAAARFPDDVVRGSVMLPLAELAATLARDAERLDGLRHRVAGTGAEGAAGLNPGCAIGPLKVLDQAGLRRIEGLAGDEIVVLPRTVPELPPVAGILSLADGNVVSHVQVLARNLGIPNASLPSGGLDALRALDGQRVLLGVTGAGEVVLVPESELPAATRERLAGPNLSSTVDEPVLAPSPDLSVQRPLTLSELHAGLSGRVVGPKAANLGELARAYPDAVAPAIAIPFGVFAAHAGQGSDSPKARLAAALAQRASEGADAESWRRELAAVERSVAALTLQPALRSELDAMLRKELGQDGQVAAFIRSDTNVEDLPGFTGAGLNKTVPNLVGSAAILAAVPEVWASPFRLRPMQWRARALANPQEVYPSVLIMKSVAADKSGVLVTRDLVTGGDGLTVATAWGVGGAVDGEEAETLILRPDGSAELVSSAKAPWKRTLPRSGGVAWQPADAGAVLTAAEQDRLRELARSLPQRLPRGLAEQEALDVEFGFVGGELTLFQVRPLVERGAALADPLLAELLPERGARRSSAPLDERPASGAR